MNEQKTKDFFEALRKKSLETTEEVILEVDGDGTYTLRSAFSTVRDGGGICVFETELFEVWENEPQVEVVVTAQFEIDPDCMEDFEEAIMNINLFTPMGYFGIYYPTDQMYYRTTNFINAELDVEEMAAAVYHLYEQVAGVVGNVHDSLERIATGQSSYDEEVEKGNLATQEE